MVKSKNKALRYKEQIKNYTNTLKDKHLQESKCQIQALFEAIDFLLLSYG